MFNLLKLSNRIKKNEGYKNHIYSDHLGNPTIGYGHLIKKKDVFSPGKTYTNKILNKVFEKDLNKAIFDFKKNYIFKTMPKNAQEVIIEMIFQLGIRKVLKFKKFNFYFKKRYYYLAALEMINSLWYRQTPRRVNKLINILLNQNEK